MHFFYPIECNFIHLSRLPVKIKFYSAEIDKLVIALVWASYVYNRSKLLSSELKTASFLSFETEAKYLLFLENYIAYTVYEWCVNILKTFQF